MIVRLLKPWKARRVGTILTDMPDGAGNMLIKRRFAEEVKGVLPDDKQAGQDDGPDVCAGAAKPERSPPAMRTKRR